MLVVGAKSFTVRYPADVAKQIGFADGERVDGILHNDAVLIRKIPQGYTLADMFGGKSPGEWRALYAELEDWGPDVGREVID